MVPRQSKSMAYNKIGGKAGDYSDLKAWEGAMEMTDANEAKRGYPEELGPSGKSLKQERQRDEAARKLHRAPTPKEIPIPKSRPSYAKGGVVKKGKKRII